MLVTIIPIVIGAFGTLTKGLLKGLEDGGHPSKRQHYWERPEYWEESWRLEETCCYSDSCEKPSVNADVKSSNEWIIMIIKTRRKNQAMAWINFKRVYDMVPQSWITNCLKMYKISHEVINYTEKTMKIWIVELAAGERSLAEAKIQICIFQGDALSPLLFIIVLMILNHILKKCTVGYKLSRSLEKINQMTTNYLQKMKKN